MNIFFKYKKKFKDRKEKSFGKHFLDFEIPCVFPEQIRNTLFNYKDDIAEVKMSSGRVGLYKIFKKRVSVIFEDTGQRDYKCCWLGYKDEK